MKVIQLIGYGGVDQLQAAEVPTPEPKAGEILVKITSTSLNPVDWKLRSGIYKDFMPLTFPAILGHDVSGEVAAVGSGVDHFRVGDKVMGFTNETYAEFVVGPATIFAALPEGFDPVEAAAIPLVVATGSQMIELGVRPKKADTVLVTGANGGVGRTAVYVAKQMGARVIAGIREQQRGQAASIHADQLVALDNPDEIAGLPEVDAIADTVSGPVMEQLIFKLKTNGVVASVLGKPSFADRSDIQVNPVSAVPDAGRLAQLAAALQRGEFEIPIVKRFPLSEAGKAQAFAEKGGVGGKVLLIP